MLVLLFNFTVKQVLYIYEEDASKHYGLAFSYVLY